MMSVDRLSARATNILLVEDDEIDVENVRRAFLRAGIPPRLWVASDAAEALRLLRGTDYPRERRLVLLDLNLPGMSGLELLRELRADPSLRSQSVVVLSTSNEERDRNEAQALNVAGYLLKPITFPSFVEMMAALYRFWSFVELP
jgi:CheY-like chemotaxis protein